MNSRNPPVLSDRRFISLIAIFSLTILSTGSPRLLAQQPDQFQAEAALIPDEQLDSLVAPIALYPDPLLAQTLAASTYPLEVIQLQQFMANNKELKDKALADAMAKHTWDPSVQAMAAFPEVVKQLGDNVAWTTDLGNAFLAQEADVMNAVQRMRAKAQGKGTLQSSAQQTVETVTVNNAQVIEIQQADPDVISVPTYNPAVVYGELPYPYPYISPPYYGALAFGAGVALGAIWGGCWGNCDWHGGGDVNINNKNNFNKNNINAGNRNNVSGGGGKWQHNASHRGGAPYGDRKTADKFGGRSRQQPANRTRPSTGYAGNRPTAGTGAGNLAGQNRQAGAGAGSNRPGGAGAGNVSAGNRPGGGGAANANRPGGGGAGTNAMPSHRATSGGANSVGNRSVSSGSGYGSSSSAFGGGGFSGSSTRSASSRGGSSMGGGGFSGGGHGGGGGRGGGGGGGGRR